MIKGTASASPIAVSQKTLATTTKGSQMTHMPGVPVNFDPPGDWKACHKDWRCYKCKSQNGQYRIHESSCGGWEDSEIKCLDCKHTYWVDGIDS
jgi:hypothetical protein